MKAAKQIEKRVHVDLPITVSIEDQKDCSKVEAKGRVDDLSISGMRLTLPLPFGMVEDKAFDFDLDLPNPFSKIKGRGEVQWKKWDEESNCIQCGLKLEPMTLKQLTDIDAIVSELSE